MKKLEMKSECLIGSMIYHINKLVEEMKQNPKIYIPNSIQPWYSYWPFFFFFCKCIHTGLETRVLSFIQQGFSFVDAYAAQKIMTSSIVCFWLRVRVAAEIKRLDTEIANLCQFYTVQSNSINFTIQMFNKFYLIFLQIMYWFNLDQNLNVL